MIIKFSELLEDFHISNPIILSLCMPSYYYMTSPWVVRTKKKLIDNYMTVLQIVPHRIRKQQHLDQLTHLRAQGIYQSGGVHDSLSKPLQVSIQVINVLIK